ncbi:hypothetical protein CFK35_19530 [Clostridium sp. cpc1]|uniref:hypothetical protein n=1 Tax=Clostridium sp. cpc1 TaxID=2016536 RepID=UPI00223F0A29|nr:hypothetical protein [Clostridium sp. cpc1]MCW8000046.1 hypothetical protein [Clostridium sp. cpc1]
MGKVLVTKKNLDKFVKEDSKSFLVDDTIILSPGVKDILDERGVRLIYKNNIDRNVEKEDILKRVSRILKEDFNIKNEEKINKITTKVLEKIKN